MSEPHSSRAERVIARCREIAQCTEIPGEITRTFLAPSMHRVHDLLGAWMRTVGMQVHVDAVGNLRAVLTASQPNAPRLLIGSHLDTVANAGAFDGILGVIIGVALVEEFAAQADSARKGIPFEIEVVGFSEEEGVRFAKPFLGSLALVGELDSAILARADENGATVAQAISDFGLDPSQLAVAELDPSTFAYLEFHIEQGPVLESECRSLAVVDAIAGQTRSTLTFTGHANHAGTTPMGSLRHDALAAAAEWIVEVERFASAAPGLVATVGKIEVPSGAANVVPGTCVATLDVRHAKDDVRSAAVDHLLRFASASGAARGVAVTHAISLDQAAVLMNPALQALLGDAVASSTGNSARIMTSGAGHDAMILACRVPSAMVFLRTPGGLSHHPDEIVLVEDVEAAIATGLEFLARLRDDRAMLDQLVSNGHTYAEARHA